MVTIKINMVANQGYHLWNQGYQDVYEDFSKDKEILILGIIQPLLI